MLQFFVLILEPLAIGIDESHVSDANAGVLGALLGIQCISSNSWNAKLVTKSPEWSEDKVLGNITTTRAMYNRVTCLISQYQNIQSILRLS